MKHYSYKLLKNLPTIREGQYANLKIDDGAIQHWLCRSPLGEYQHHISANYMMIPGKQAEINDVPSRLVYVHQLINQDWKIVDVYIAQTRKLDGFDIAREMVLQAERRSYDL